MKQQKFDQHDKTKTLNQIQKDVNPTIWEVGRKFDFGTGSYLEVNGKPDFSKGKK